MSTNKTSKLINPNQFNSDSISLESDQSSRNEKYEAKINDKTALLKSDQSNKNEKHKTSINNKTALLKLDRPNGNEKYETKMSDKPISLKLNESKVQNNAQKNIPTLQNNKNLNKKDSQMENLNNQSDKEAAGQQINLYLCISTLFLDMVQKLTKNNMRYAKDILSNSLKLMQPLANQERQNFVKPMQDVFVETCESNNKLCQDAREIIIDTTDKIKDEVEKYQHDLDSSKLNLLALWSKLNPSVADMLKTLEEVVPPRKGNSI